MKDRVEQIAKAVEELAPDKGWDPQPNTITPAGPDLTWPEGETLSLTYHPVPDIA